MLKEMPMEGQNIVFEGRSDRHTVGQKLQEWFKRRYTEAGRIRSELEKAEKITGALTPEQRAEATEKMHLEGKIKNKVAVTVVKDAVAAAAVVTGVSFLAARPDVRANISTSLNVATRVSGEAVSGQLKKASEKFSQKYQPGFLRNMILSMINGAKTLTEKGSGKVAGVFDKMADSSLKSMHGRVVKADVAAQVLDQTLSEEAKQKGAEKLKKAFGKVARLARREVIAETFKEAGKSINLEAVQSGIKESKSRLNTAVSAGVMINNALRAEEVASRVAEKVAKINKKS